MKTALLLMVVMCAGCNSDNEMGKMINEICGDNLRSYDFRRGPLRWDWDITVSCEGKL